MNDNRKGSIDCRLEQPGLSTPQRSLTSSERDMALRAVCAVESELCELAAISRV